MKIKMEFTSLSFFSSHLANPRLHSGRASQPTKYTDEEDARSCPRKVIKKKFQVKSTLPIPNMLR